MQPENKNLDPFVSFLNEVEKHHATVTTEPVIAYGEDEVTRYINEAPVIQPTSTKLLLNADKHRAAYNALPALFHAIVTTVSKSPQPAKGILYNAACTFIEDAKFTATQRSGLLAKLNKAFNTDAGMISENVVVDRKGELQRNLGIPSTNIL